MLITCNNCSQHFDKKVSEIKKTKHHFCSLTCSAIFNNKGKQRNKPIRRTCKHCSDVFYRNKNNRSSSFCELCNKSKRYKDIAIGEYRKRLSIKNKHPSWTHSHVRAFNREWNKNLLKYPCQKCSYSTHVELCHIQSIASFSNETLLSEINDPSNILVLCPNHHWEFDNKILNLVDIPNRT